MAAVVRYAASSLDGETLSLRSGLALYAPMTVIGFGLGAALRHPEIGSALIFLPYAALTAALLLSPRRDWGWYIALGAAAHLATHWPRWPLSWVLLAEVANVARAATAALLIHRLVGRRPRLDGVGEVMRFVVASAVAGPAVGATLGAANVILHGGALGYGAVWLAWFTSSAITGLTFLPACLLIGERVLRARGGAPPAARLAEGTALAAAIAAACAALVMGRGDARWPLSLAVYVPLPLLVWAALRFGVRGASVALSALTLAGVVDVDRGMGALFAGAGDANVLALQSFVILTAVPVLCLAAASDGCRAIVRLHEAFLASVHHHVAIVDRRGVVHTLNDAWARADDEPGGPPFPRLAVGADLLRVCAAGARRGDHVAKRALAGALTVLDHDDTHFEMKFDDARSGSVRWYVLRIEALRRADGGAIVSRFDVTGRHRELAEIDEQRRELQHLARVAALGQFSSTLAHELNQPLASVGSNAEAARLMLRRRPVDLEELAVIVEDILTENLRAADVIRGLRALVRPGETQLQPLDLVALVRGVLELARAELAARAVTATAVTAPEPPLVFGDRVQLQQVLLNLVLNACEAMQAIPADQRRLVASVASTADGDVHVAIRDSGPGIAPPLLDRLFTPFLTTKTEGLGLGLSISRTIVAAHGGRLWAANNVDGGATLHCVLPAATADNLGRPALALPDPSLDPAPSLR